MEIQQRYIDELLTPGRNQRQRGTDQLSLPGIFVIMIFLSLLMLGCDGKERNPQAIAGVFDLTNWDFDKNGTAEMSGEWIFYDQLFLTPDNISGVTDSEKTAGRPSPFRLSDPAAGDHGTHAGEYGTFQLLIKMPPVRHPMTLAMRGPSAAYRLWINGLPAADDGVAGKLKTEETPGKRGITFIPLILTKNDGAALELVLQISSHYGRPVSKTEPFRIGPQERITAQWDKARGFLIASVSILMLMGCYHLVLFAFRAKDPSPFYFAMFCLLWMTHFGAFSSNRWIIYYILPDLNYMTVDRIEMISYFFTIPFLLLFFQALFPDETPSFFPKAYVISACCLSLFLFSEAWFVFGGLTIAHMVSASAIVISLVILFRALIHKRPSAMVIFTGGIILDLCGANDMLYDLKLIDTGYFMRAGLLVFILCQSWALARRSSLAFSSAENLFAQVQEKNIVLSNLDRLKDEFLATTSHELRTPLNGIIGIAESLLSGAAGNMTDAIRSNLAMIVYSGRRLARLVNEILDFSRLKNKDVSLVKKAVHIHATVRSVAAILEKTLSNKNVTLEIRIPDELPPILGDEDRIQQILYNLLGNAIKFTEKGLITILAEVSGEMVSVAVRDTGVGIPGDKIERIFEPFEQDNSHPPGNGKGTGLGLAISRNLVELHGGKIWADSFPGRGSTFTFTLPLANADSQAEQIPLNTIPDIPDYYNDPIAFSSTVDVSFPGETIPSGFTVLVVDDDPINLQVAANHLTTAGHAVQTAVCGIDALEKIDTGKTPDLVLLDIFMPGMSGHEVCRTIRAHHAPHVLPVVMLTAGNRTKDLLEGFAAGANDYLSKPFSGQELIARVNTQLQLKKAFDTLNENTRLKIELTRRKETQQQLLLMQRRLSEMLDMVPDTVLAVNEDDEIAFCNRACQKFLGYSPEALLGIPISEISSPETKPLLNPALNLKPLKPDDAPIVKITFRRADGTNIPTDTLITPLELEDEHLNVFLIGKPAIMTENLLARHPENEPTLNLIAELNRHQDRLRTLEDSLNAVLPTGNPHSSRIWKEIKALDTALEAVRQAELASEQKPDKAALAVSVINLSIDYWIESTGRGKFDLARQSGLWKVYTNKDGWERTQTLDKYLSMDTLPEKPRWRQILATGDFVLTVCQKPSALRSDLESFLEKFRIACR